MNHTRRVFVCLLGLVVILSILVFPISAQGNDSGAVNLDKNETVNYENATSYPPQQNELDILAESQRGFDRSLIILNSITTMFGAMVGALAVLIALSTALVGGFGLSELKKWRSVREDIEKYKITIEKDAGIIRGIITKAEKDAETIRNELNNLPQIVSNEKPTDEVLRKLDDFSRHLETLELMGASLKPKDYINMGENFYFKEEYGSALKAFNKAIELEPNNDIAWSNKGFALCKLGQYNDAIEACDKSIELDPDDVYSLFNRACAYSQLGNKEKALSDLEKTIELDVSYKEKAKKDEDFKNLRDDEKFKKLVE